MHTLNVVGGGSCVLSGFFLFKKLCQLKNESSDPRYLVGTLFLDPQAQQS
jgi:hypothetical protein